MTVIFTYPDAGTLPTVFRATAGIQCGETAHGETIDPQWPATTLVPGDFIRINVSLFTSENGPQATIYQYIFVMGERDIIGGRLDDEATLAGTATVSSPVATPGRETYRLGGESVGGWSERPAITGILRYPANLEQQPPRATEQPSV